MELVSYSFPAKGREGDTLLLMPVGDIQWSGDRKGVALGMLKRHIEWGVDKGAYFLGMGDYIDTFSPSNRASLRGTKLYDSARAAISAKAVELTEEIYDKALAPSKGRWFGLLEGHHFAEVEGRGTTDQILAEKLESKFLGSSAYVRLKFIRDHKGAGGNNVDIWAHHGAGGGGREGSPLNKLDQVPRMFAADIYLMGHQHKKPAATVPYIQPYYPKGGGEPRLIHRKRILAGTGSFLKGYIEGAKDGSTPRGNYVEQKMLLPLQLGGVLVKITPRWKDMSDGNTIWLPDFNVEL